MASVEPQSSWQWAEKLVGARGNPSGQGSPHISAGNRGQVMGAWTEEEQPLGEAVSSESVWKVESNRTAVRSHVEWERRKGDAPAPPPPAVLGFFSPSKWTEDAALAGMGKVGEGMPRARRRAH